MQVTTASVIGRSGEDRFLTVKRESISLFAVLDGHGGSQTVEFIKANLVKVLFKKLEQGNGIRRAIVNTFFELDRGLFTKGVAQVSGSTATLVIITPEMVYVACLGDSRCLLLSREGIVLETVDHSPSTEREKRRISSSGGKVVSVLGVDRVAGELAVSRSFGDFSLKRSNRVFGYDPRGWISVIPELYQLSTSSVESVLLATDGLWETSNSAQLSREVKRIGVKQLVERAKRNTTDDVTAIYVVL